MDSPVEPVAVVEDLSLSLVRNGVRSQVLKHVDLQIRPGEILGLVGESGSGKSVLALSLLGLLPPESHPVTDGRVTVDGVDLLHARRDELRRVRREVLGAIFQDPMTSLNPTMRIGRQIGEATGDDAESVRLLETVGVRDAELRLRVYPHELSGGLRQRVMAAIAVAGHPRLVVADEPTTALDVTVQAQVVDLLMRLQRELGFALVFVSHDLALVAELTHRITVMYAGQVVEQGTTSEVLSQPVHEYTQGLLGAVLSIEAGSDRLHQVSGVVPSPRDFPAGDRFAPRSSDPARFAGVTPERRRIDGTEHYYSAHPDDAPVAANGAGR